MSSKCIISYFLLNEFMYAYIIKVYVRLEIELLRKLSLHINVFV